MGAMDISPFTEGHFVRDTESVDLLGNTNRTIQGESQVKICLACIHSNYRSQCGLVISAHIYIYIYIYIEDAMRRATAAPLNIVRLGRAIEKCKIKVKTEDRARFQEPGGPGKSEQER